MGAEQVSVPPEELVVLRLHMQGLSDSAIARREGVSLATVRRRAARARQRCGARTRAEAIAILAASGALEVSSPVSTSSHEDVPPAGRSSTEESTGV